MKLAEIAEAVGVSVAMVSMIRAGKRRMSWRLAKRFSETFGRSPAWWMDASGAKFVRAASRGGERAAA